jgi:hypothetical protein
LRDYSLKQALFSPESQIEYKQPASAGLSQPEYIEVPIPFHGLLLLMTLLSGIIYKMSLCLRKYAQTQLCAKTTQKRGHIYEEKNILVYIKILVCLRNRFPVYCDRRIFGYAFSAGYEKNYR